MRNWNFQTLFDRGMLEDAIVRDELFADIAAGKRLTIYQGFDPTSPNMHIGHMMGFRVLRWFQLHGHRVIVLLGDFTARIGDPSDRPEARKRLTHEQVMDNARTYRDQVARILELEGENPAEVKFNGEWLDGLTLKQFIEIMDKFTVQNLLERNMFQERMKRNEPLFLNEMVYPILQGYDSVAMEVDVELGASDQLFNMMRGRDLVRSYLGKPKHVITTSLLPGLDGRKMSKTYGNTVDLTEEPVPMYFKLTLIQDNLLPTLMKALTDIPMEDIAIVEERLKTESNLVDAREVFAHSLVSALYSVEAADQAREEFHRVISEGELPSDIPDLQLEASAFTDGAVSITDLVATSGLVSSKGDARRVVQQNGVRLNGQIVNDPRAPLSMTRLAGALLKVGKRGYVRVRIPS